MKQIWLFTIYFSEREAVGLARATNGYRRHKWVELTSRKIKVTKSNVR